MSQVRGEPRDDFSDNAYERGRLLYQHRRYKEALGQFVEALKERGDDPYAMAYIGLCWLQVGQKKRATEVVQQAISMDPDCVFAHSALCEIYRSRRMGAAAQEAIQKALALSPERADLLGVAAMVACDQKRWQEALDLTARGLALDTGDDTCTHARAWALVNLGRFAEGEGLLNELLREHPEDAHALCSLGYSALRQGQRERALEQFSSSLALDPEGEMARDGFLDALHMKYPIYGWVVRYLLFVSSLPDKLRWALLVAEHFAERFLKELAQRYPVLRPLVSWLLWGWSIFSYLTFTARPLCNSLLRFNRYGRKLLKPEEVIESNLVTGSILIGMAAWGWWHWTHRVWSLVACIIYFTLVVPVTNIFSCPPGWPRKLMAGFFAALAIIGNLAIWGFFDNPLSGGGALELLRIYGWLLLINQLVAIKLDRSARD